MDLILGHAFSANTLDRKCPICVKSKLTHICALGNNYRRGYNYRLPIFIARGKRVEQVSDAQVLRVPSSYHEQLPDYSRLILCAKQRRAYPSPNPSPTAPWATHQTPENTHIILSTKTRATNARAARRHPSLGQRNRLQKHRPGLLLLRPRALGLGHVNAPCTKLARRRPGTRRSPCTRHGGAAARTAGAACKTSATCPVHSPPAAGPRSSTSLARRPCARSLCRAARLRRERLSELRADFLPRRRRDGAKTKRGGACSRRRRQAPVRSRRHGRGSGPARPQHAPAARHHAGVKGALCRQQRALAGFGDGPPARRRKHGRERSR